MAVTATLITSGSSAESHGTGSVSTASITPSSGNFLAVFVLVQPNSSADVASATTISGGSLTYTARATQGLPGTGSTTQAVCFTSTAAGGSAFTLTFDCGANNIFWYKWFVYEVAGGAVAAPTAATATGTLGTGSSNSVDGADSITLSAAPASSSVVVAAIGVDAETDATNGASPDTGWTEDGQVVPTAGSFDGYAQAMQRGGSTSTAVSWADVKTGPVGAETFGAAQLAVELVQGGDGTATPAAISMAAFIPAATATGGGSGTATPTAIPIPASIPAATPAAGATTGPAAIAVAFAFEAASVGGSVTVDTTALSVVIPAATATGGGSGTATPTAIPIPVSIPAASALAGSTATPAAITLTINVPAVITQAGATRAPAVIPLTVTLPAAAATGTSAGTATPNAIAVVTVIPSPTLQHGYIVNPAAIQLAVTVGTVLAQGTPPDLQPVVVTLTGSGHTVTVRASTSTVTMRGPGD